MAKAAKPKAKSNSVDIKIVNSNIVNKNWNFFNDLSESERKTVQPIIVAGWLSRTCSPNQLVNLNNNVNPVIFSLYKHPLLIIQLLTTCFNKKPLPFQQWIPFVKKVSQNKTIKVICEYFNYNTSQAKEILSLLTSDDIINYAEELGYQKEEIDGLKKEM